MPIELTKKLELIMTSSKSSSRRRFLGNLSAAGMAGGVVSAAHADAASGSAAPSARNYFDMVLNPCFVDERIDSRSVSFENPTGKRGVGCLSMLDGARKSKAGRAIASGERVVLADIKGPGTLRHIWMALSWVRPEIMRALRFEGFYDGMSEPSISVPVADFFGLPHGRATEFYSQLITAPEGRGVNSYIPMPFGRSVRMELVNESDEDTSLAYQIDYTLEPLLPERTHYLHASFRRENPTALRRDFVVTEGLKGPGRFLGCVVGIRVLDKTFYGEGEMKVYRDGDGDLPTVCGTGLEDYVGSAFGLSCHYGPYAGTPLWLAAPDADKSSLAAPDFLSFYRWHVPDPIMFSKDLRVTVQQIGWIPKFESKEELERYKATHLPVGGRDWVVSPDGKRLLNFLAERQDDYSATAFVYCRTPQAVPRLNIKSATANIARMSYEGLTPFEELMKALKK